MKDTSNLLEYNQWSAGDYSNDLTGITNRYDTTSITTSENIYSTTGENSIHVKSLNTDFKAVDIGPFDVLANETYVLTADVINKNASNVQLRLNEPGVGNSTVSISMSNVWNNFFISRTVEQNGSLLIRLVVQSIGDVYIDNILLKQLP